MFRRWITCHVVTGIVMAFVVAPPASAQGQPPGTVNVNAAITAIHQFAGELDDGGQAGWSSAGTSVGVTRQFVPAFAAGLSARYGTEDWRFESPVAFDRAAPWTHLTRTGVGINTSLALSRTFVIGVSPSLEWPAETGANTGDALIYGAVVSAVKVFSPRFLLGGGASIYRQFYDVKTSVFVIVNWQLTDKLRITNALPAGPEGGAGVELRDALTPDWDLAAGGVYRSDRFRLRSTSPAMGDVGEPSSIPIFARVSRRLGPSFKFDVYAGALFNGKLTVRDANGRELASDGYRTAPAIAATVSFKR
ncbi:MAG: hypothetical protein ACHQ52_06780 [Candidatus Eisenbacteria bacterium]